MKTIYRNIDGSYVYDGDLDELVFSEEHSGYIHEDDVRDVYRGNEDIEIYEFNGYSIPELLPIEESILNYIVLNTGKNNEISMHHLANKYGMNDRQIRDVIFTLRTAPEVELVIGSNNNGYYLAKGKEEEIEAYRVLDSRTESTLKLLLKKNPSLAGKYFNLIRESTKASATMAQGQTRFDGVRVDQYGQQKK